MKGRRCRDTGGRLTEEHRTREGQTAEAGFQGDGETG